MVLSQSGALEKSCEVEGAKMKYAFLCANAYLNNGQKETLIWGTNSAMVVNSKILKDASLMKRILKNVGGLINIY